MPGITIGKIPIIVQVTQMSFKTYILGDHKALMWNPERGLLIKNPSRFGTSRETEEGGIPTMLCPVRANLGC